MVVMSGAIAVGRPLLREDCKPEQRNTATQVLACLSVHML